MWIEGLNIHSWVLVGPTFQEFIDFTVVVGEICRRFPSALVQRIPMNHP